MIGAAILLFALTAPGVAQETAVPTEPTVAPETADLAALRACLDAAERDPEAERACVGKPSGACLAGPEATTTVAIGACFAGEAAAWSVLMREVYDSAAAMAGALDALDPAAEPVAPLLETAQEAWEAFRDADCAQEAALWTDGSMRLVAGPQCAMEHAAERTLDLMAKRRAFESP